MNSSGFTSNASGRRAFVKGVGMAGLGLAGAAVITTNLASPDQQVHASGINDVDILNFALNLEYLEAEYYCVATTGKTLVELGVITSSDETGPTTGGSMIAGLSSSQPASFLAPALRINEVDHVVLLRNALGAAAVKKPAINLAALGYGFADMKDFFKISRQLEEVGTSAYLGAAPLLMSEAYVAVAGSILTVEAKHAGALRMACIQFNVSSPAVDSLDLIPDLQHPFNAINEGLTTPRTPSQVLKIVYGGGTSSGGFFPSGLNGNITTAS